MATPRAILTRVRGVHRPILSTGPCCLVRQQGGELAPRRVLDAVRQTLVVRHPVDRQVFDGEQIKLVHDATTLLMREIAPPPSRARMHAGDHLALGGALWGALGELAVRPLHPGQRVFLVAEAAGGWPLPGRC